MATPTTKMIDDVRGILSPLLTVSYLFGLRILEYPAGKPRIWCGYLYIMLVWTTYSVVLAYTLICYLNVLSYVYQFCFWLNVFTAMLTAVLGTYYDQRFRSCLKKIATVDDTLEKLGTSTDYQTGYTTVLLTVFGWLLFIVWTTVTSALWHKERNDAIKYLFIAFMFEYSSYTNLLDDLIVTSTIGYIGLKFDQINEHLRKIESENESKLKPTWGYSKQLPCHTGYPKSTGSECVTWIVMYYKKFIHLHLELHKISRELNSIFGLQMTVKMGTYFAFIALGFSELFNIILNNNYINKAVLFAILTITFLFLNMFRLFIINYMCENVSLKADAMGDVINRIPYTTYDGIVRENISQLLLQMSLVPLKFDGLGLFQFGLKFFQGFTSSVTTVLVILVQSHTEKEKRHKEI